MHSTQYLASLAALASVVMAEAPVAFCKDSVCEDCPTSVITAGSAADGNCVIYNSGDIFKGAGFEGSEEGGGYKPYMDINPESGCQLILRTPANTEELACGVVRGRFAQPACATYTFEQTFMLSTCCGTEDCVSEGGPSRIKRGLGSSLGSGGLYLQYENGTRIEPVAVGPSPEKRELLKREAGVTEASNEARNNLFKRECNKSWKSRRSYTKPAPNTQLMSNAVNGESTIQVTSERTQEWSTSMEIGIADILSLGLSASFSESESKGNSVTVNIAPGQSGALGFTAILSCEEGSGVCNGGDVDGEVCWPTLRPDGMDVYGEYSVIIGS